MTDQKNKLFWKKSWPVPQFFLIFLFAVPLLWPILRGQSFCTHDGNLHVYRLAALRHAIEQGLCFSRWTPGLVFGYGFPFFNFREWLSYYIPEILHLLGVAIPAALNLVYGASLVLAGWGAYMLARDIWNDDKAGLASAIAYISAPYLLLDIYVRGNLPESMALSLLPWIVWLFRRLILSPSRRCFFAAALLITTLLLTHNISSLLFIPVLVIYLLFLLFQIQSKQWTLPAVALIVGVTLAAFAWLPAMAEKGSVQLYLTHSSRGNDFHYNTVSLTELFSLPAPSDPSLLNPPLQVPVGLPQLTLGLAGVFGWFFFHDQSRRWHVALFAIITGGLILLALPISTTLWEILPLIRFVQFPWRLVGRAALPLALLAGAPITFIPHRLSLAVLTPAIVVMVILAFPWLYPPSCSIPEFPTIADVMRFERNSGLTGVDPLGAYLPRWVVERPSGSPMETALRDGTTPRRFDSTRLPSGAVLLVESYGPNRATLEIDTPDPFQALFHTFFFPGWTVRIDGQPVHIDPTPDSGLISFPVPAGSHTIIIRWELTPLRSTAAAISFASLLILVMTGWRAKIFKSLQHSRLQVQTETQQISNLSNSTLITLALLSILLLTFKQLLVDPMLTPLRRSALADNILPDLNQPVDGSSLHLADGMELLGYRVQPAPAGDELVIDLAWTVRQKPAGSYQSRIALLDQDGRIWSAKETYRPRAYQKHPPTNQWQPGTWVWDSHSVPILPGTPPGEYSLQLVVFEKQTLSPLNVLDAGGAVIGPDALIGQVKVQRPKPGEITTDAFKIQYRFDRNWDDLTLLGVNLDREEAAPGDPVLISLFWQAKAPLPHLAVQLELVDPDGSSVRRWVLPPVREDYTTSVWPADDPVIGQHLLQVPGAAKDGFYSWRLNVLNSSGYPLNSPLVIGEIKVNAPQRVWQAPPVDQPVDIHYTFDSGASFARLAGYNSTMMEKSLELTLVWQALEETETGYRVYVHLLAPDGSMATQSDGVPAEWTRPTSGWAAGEYITDRHSLDIPADLPPGDYRLAVGFYNLKSGLRLDASRVIPIRVKAP